MKTLAPHAWVARQGTGLMGLILLWLALPAQAHNADTSYARITISSNEVEFRLTYDVTTLLRIAPLDANEDRHVTPKELLAQADRIGAYLRNHVYPQFNADEGRLGLMLPPIWPANAGERIAQGDYNQSLITFVFKNPARTQITDVGVFFDFFNELGDRHTVLGLFKHGRDEHDVMFTRFEPDYLYDTTVAPQGAGEVVAMPSSQAAGIPLGSSEAMLQQMGRFLKLGVHHIFLGYDHILFLMGLIVMSRFLDLLKIVTSFTVAHTITLILATLQVVNMSSRLIEISIALTIIYVAAENLFIKTAKSRWRLTFAFGLVHGFGFANVLRELGLPQSGLIRSLLAFNLGVEVGQLIIVLAAIPLIYWITRKSWGHSVQNGISTAILIFGCGWFIERAFGLGFMPF